MAPVRCACLLFVFVSFVLYFFKYVAPTRPHQAPTACLCENSFVYGLGRNAQSSHTYFCLDIVGMNTTYFTLKKPDAPRTLAARQLPCLFCCNSHATSMEVGFSITH